MPGRWPGACVIPCLWDSVSDWSHKLLVGYGRAVTLLFLWGEGGAGDHEGGLHIEGAEGQAHTEAASFADTGQTPVQ